MNATSIIIFFVITLFLMLSIETSKTTRPLNQLVVISIAENNQPLMKPQVFQSRIRCDRTKNLMLDLLKGLRKDGVIDVICKPYFLPTETDNDS